MKGTRGPLSYLRISNPVARCFKEFFLYFSSSCFQFSNITPHYSYRNLKSKLKFTFLSQLLVTYTKRTLCSTLEPLYCSSYATAVEGIRFIIFFYFRHTLLKTRIKRPAHQFDFSNTIDDPIEVEEMEDLS